MKNISLLLLLICILVLIGVRVVLSGTITYVFLIWNIILACIPFLLSEHLKKQAPHFSIKCVLLFTSWLLFLPNALYIITDLIHLQQRASIPIWYDALLLFTAAFTGLLLGMLSMAGIEQFFKKIYTKATTFLLMMGCLFAASFGIYLGRFLRFNSWDVVNQPAILLYEIADRICHPLQHTQTWSVTLAFTFFSCCSWLIFKNLKKQLLV